MAKKKFQIKWKKAEKKIMADFCLFGFDLREKSYPAYTYVSLLWINWD